MLRFLIYFLVIAALSGAAAWFAERPGTLSMSWMGYEIETTFLFAVIVVLMITITLIAAWVLLRGLIDAPGALADFFRLRRQRRGYDALSRGMIAVGSGDAEAAARHAAEAGRLIASEPMAQLLKAQTAQMKGDRRSAVRVFESMLQAPETEILGLRGLFIQAQRDDQPALARNFAERAAAINPALDWASEAVLTFQSANQEWENAGQTLEQCRRHKLIDRNEAAAKRAVLLTARALQIEDEDERAARDLALQAHRLNADLVPAAVVAGRILAAEGEMRKAARVLEKTWKLAPHPDIAEVYGDLRHGDSPRERLKRVKTLVKKGGASPEGPIAIARAAIEAREWDEARTALEPLAEDRPSVRVCMMMAEIEEGESGDRGRAREWLARALKAPRDPQWTADGHVSEDWLPVSPATGELGAFTWRVPVEALAHAASEGPEREAASDAEVVIEAKTDKASEPVSKQDAEGAKKPTADAAAARAEEEPRAARKTTRAKKRADADEDRMPGADVLEDEREADSGPEEFIPPRPPDDPGPEAETPEPRGWLAALLAR